VPVWYEDAAKKIQDLYLECKKNEAIAAVPDSLLMKSRSVVARANQRSTRSVAGSGGDYTHLRAKQRRFDSCDRLRLQLIRPELISNLL